MKLERLGVILMDTALYWDIRKRENGNNLYRSYGDPETVKKAIEIGKKQNLDALIGPEWSLMKCPEDVRAYSEKERDSIIADLKKCSEGSEMLIFPGTLVYHSGDKLKNLLPVLQDGKLVYSYHKKEDGGTWTFDPSRMFYPGTERNVFELGRLKIGVEICADKEKIIACNAKDLDLQVLVSAGIGITRSALKNGAVFLCSDGGAGSRNPYHVARGCAIRSAVEWGAEIECPATSKPEIDLELKSCEVYGARLHVYRLP